MSLVIETFEDLLEIVTTHPQWRERLRDALFPDLNIAQAFQNMADSRKRMDILLERLSVNQGRIIATLDTHSQDITQLKTDVSEIKTDVSGLKTDVSEIKTDVSGLKADVSGLKTDVSRLTTNVSKLNTDVAYLKGDVFESRYRAKMASIFGRLLRKGYLATNEIADKLYEAMEQGVISVQDIDAVLATDVLWKGEFRTTKQDVVLVVETSWVAEVHDATRAKQRAGIIQKLGIFSLPVVASKEWAESAIAAAKAEGVVMAINGKIAYESWNNAIQLNS